MEIRIEDLNQFYGKKQALKHVDLVIPSGMFGLLGKNGAGKTTLMKVLAALLKKSSGKVTICGVPVENTREIRSITGYLPQDFSMYGNMSAAEALDYLGALSGMKKAERRKRIPLLLEEVNLGDKGNVRIRAMSGGMRRRLGIAQAILHDPKILIVDEPTAGLDPEERVRFRNLLCGIAQDRIVILSTHIVGDVEATCENIGILMFGTLFLKECRQIGKSIVYYVFVACLLGFFLSQLGAESWELEKPEPGQADYGSTYTDDGQIVMERTAGALALDYMQNRYAAYPLGFYRSVALSGEKQAQMDGIMRELTGCSEEELDALIREYIREAEANSEEGVVIVPDVPVSGTLSYERFRELMDQVNRLIGGHSAYDPEYLEHSTRVPQTYEGALEAYSTIVEKDRYTGAFARIFCDYMGLLLSLLPVFLAVARILKDKRVQASQVIWSKRASSSCIILSRYLAALAMTMLPVILTAACCHFRCASAAAAAGIPADQLAFVKYIAGWLLPGAAFTLAAGFLISELTEGIWAVLFHGLFWFYSIFQSFTGLNGNFGLKFVPRFNSFGNTELFFSQLSDLIANRIVYLALAVLLIMLCVPVYSWKRRGSVK